MKKYEEGSRYSSDAAWYLRLMASEKCMGQYASIADEAWASTDAGRVSHGSRRYWTDIATGNLKSPPPRCHDAEMRPFISVTGASIIEMMTADAIFSLNWIYRDEFTVSTWCRISSRQRPFRFMSAYARCPHGRTLISSFMGMSPFLAEKSRYDDILGHYTTNASLRAAFLFVIASSILRGLGLPRLKREGFSDTPLRVMM